jgi:hypothetical protein
MPNFYKVEINRTEWEVPQRYQMLTPVGSGAYGQVWWVTIHFLKRLEVCVYFDPLIIIIIKKCSILHTLYFLRLLEWTALTDWFGLVHFRRANYNSFKSSPHTVFYRHFITNVTCNTSVKALSKAGLLPVSSTICCKGSAHVREIWGVWLLYYCVCHQDDSKSVCTWKDPQSAISPPRFSRVCFVFK